MKGRCLCGAITLEVTEHSRELSACHCAMCRRWTGAVLMGFDAPEAAVRVTGSPRIFRSSSFAERAFCGECGSHLWFRDIEGDVLEIMPGLFERDAPLTLVREVFIDAKPAGYAFAGEHVRVDSVDYAADNLVVPDEETRDGETP